jgi:glycosyltransferase involved in cell wall biosynthesis
MRRTRILRIATRLNTGGPTIHLVTLHEALAQRGYEQWLVTGREAPHEGSMRAFVEARGIQPFFVPEMVATSRLSPADAVALARIRRLIRKLRPDIVETHMSKAGIVGRLAAHLEGVPIVIHVYHGHVLAGYYGIVKSRIARCAERILARTSDHLVAVSARVKDDLVKFGVAPAARISVVEPGLEVRPLVHSRQQRGSLRRELGVDSTAPLVGLVGRLCPVKNPRLFLDAAIELLAARPDARFLVVGDGELGPEIRAHARRHNLTKHVIFAGWRNDLPRVYADLDVLVSCSSNEGTPLAIIEAMLAACPVVATSVGGVPDLIDDDVTGRLVPPGQATPLAAAVLRLLHDPRLAAALADAAQRRAQVRFCTTRLAAEMDALYSELLHRHGIKSVGVQSPIAEGQTTVPCAMGVDTPAPERAISRH